MTRHALPTPLRNQLAKVIKEARRVAEEGAVKALQALAVDRAEAFGSMGEDERALRRRLRAHGRQVGDVRDRRTGEQTVHRLAHEVAYEHWHRMLFARFLAENGLLIEPAYGVAVSLDECRELARERGGDPWELAAGFARRMLPQIFRADDPALEVRLAPEVRLRLERLLESLPAEVFTAEDSLGWTYQFWQAEAKEAVNARVKSGTKVGAEELPAVTQLFTEHYMVQFLFHNTIGAWRAGKLLAERPELATGAADEDELRRAVRLAALGGYEFSYLRFTSPPGPLSMNGEGEEEDGSADRGIGVATEQGGEEGGDLAWRVEGDPVVSGNFVTREKLEMARELRRQPTPKEVEVWEWLRDRRMLGLKWRRQQIIDGFIADFYCAECRLALEIDGGIHELDAVRSRDQERDQIFARHGITTLRIRNEDCTRERLKQLIEEAISPPPTNPDGKVPSQNEVPTSPSPFMERGPGGEVWRPAAGTFPGWPRAAAELRVLDPCCGSGHFLVEGLHILVRLRMEEEGLGVEEAIGRVLAENLYGLEIDPRCTQIAAFNVALAAWKLAGRPITLPPLNIACSGLAPNASKEEWLRLAEEAAAAGGMAPERDLYGTDETLLSSKLREGLEALYDLFEQAPVLGSLIDPRSVAGDLYRAGFDDLRALLAPILEAEADGDETREHAVAAQGMARAAELLAGRYTLVITNVPYLTRGKQGAVLREFCERRYPEAKNGLATVFLDRCLGSCATGGTSSLVLPQNWLFLTNYRKLREKLLKNETWHLVARLGPQAFQTPMWDFNVQLLAISHASPPPGGAHAMAGLDVSEPRTAAEKAEGLLAGEIKLVGQAKQLENPDARVAFDAIAGQLLERYASSHQGIKTGDDAARRRFFWEQVDLRRWAFLQSTVDETTPFGGLESVVDWANQGADMARLQGVSAWQKQGVAVSQMSDLPVAIFLGHPFDSNVSALPVRNVDEIVSIWCFCSAPEYLRSVRLIDQSLKVTNAALVKVPFDLAHWQKVAAEKYPHGLPEPQSNDPTQWLFHGHPAGMVGAGPAERSPFGIADPVGADRHPSLVCREPNPGDVLQVAVARLLGYRWPAELDDEMELDEASRAWVERCRGFLEHADGDGIVCLPAVRGEAPAAARLRRLLAAAFGKAWSPEVERRLLAAAAEARNTRPAGSLEEWLRDRFFEEHCKLFHHRPFVWHLWDGRRDGFHALVSYHRLAGPDGEGRRTLESLTYSYLGDWIQRQDAEAAAGHEGAEGRLLAARDLQDQLERILQGEPPYDLFIRWKPLAEQPIGWDPDIDDGVRLNIRPFMRAELAQGGRKGAGILRWKPNIKWSKDRGKEPQPLRPRADYPWFWSCPGDGATDFPGGETYDGIRWNDLHYTNATKRVARERAPKGDGQ